MTTDGTPMRRVLLLVLTLASAAACAEGAADADSIRADSTAAATAAAASTPAAGASAATSATGGGSPGVGQAAGAAAADTPRVQVTMKEWTMEISRDTVPAGTVIFDFVNAGTEEHELEVELGDREWEAGEVGPGGKGSMPTTLTPGTWIIYCPLASPSANGAHKIRGQQTTIVVK
jgi:plastocyanin